MIVWKSAVIRITKRRKRMKQKKNLSKSIIAFCVLAVIAVLMVVAYKQFMPKGQEGSKKVVVSVVIPEEKTKDFTLHTDAEFLRQALQEKDLIQGSESQYGFYITEVNGRAADDANQEWWCITKSGETVNTGVDQTPLADGDHYELTLMVGYDQ
jgi:hypothetical protein